MSRLPITTLRRKHRGRDIYIIGSGPSAGFITPEFFNNKIAIGINEVYLRFSNVRYIVRKERTYSQAAYQSGIPLIVSRHHCGDTRNRVTKFDGPYKYYVFDHEMNQETEVDLSVIGTDKIVVSYSTATSAMHIAAYMGAANIILVGLDCGLIDGQINYPGYRDSPYKADFYRWFITQIEPQTLQVRDRLKEVYGCNTYSLNPFINLGMEGHHYER